MSEPHPGSGGGWGVGGGLGARSSAAHLHPTPPPGALGARGSATHLHPAPHPRAPCRTKLLESEAMNESLRRSLSRASARGPYSLGASPAAPASSMEDASEVIRRAKQDLERLKKKEVRQRRKR